MKILRLLAILLLFVQIGAAQTSTGAVQGTVLDSQGAFVAHATVVANNIAINTARGTETDENGWFRIDGLQPGDYQIQAAALRFANGTVRLPVRVGEVASTSIRLAVAGAPETVEVCEIAPNTETVVISNPVSQYEIQNIPLANRSFANIAYIAPMTAPVEPSDPTKARITAVSFAGSSGLNVDLSVDGGDNNDDYIGGFLQNYSPEAIREFNVRTAQFEPDTSRTNGGSIIISTRSGTNQWHGSASGFFRSTALNARNTLDNPEPNPKQPYGRQDLVGALGGPLKRDRLWLFTSYEYSHQDASVAYSAFTLSQFHALAQLASEGQIPGVASIPVTSSVGGPFRDSLFNSRLDWQQSQRSRWFLRFSLDRNLTMNDLVQQGATQSTGFTTRSNYYSVLANNSYSFSDRWIASTVIEALRTYQGAQL